VLATLGIQVTHSDLFGPGGREWLNGLRLPQPYSGKVCSLLHLTSELTTEIDMLADVTRDLLAGHRGGAPAALRRFSGVASTRARRSGCRETAG
jgi:hypothetical protein